MEFIIYGEHGLNGYQGEKKEGAEGKSQGGLPSAPLPFPIITPLYKLSIRTFNPLLAIAVIFGYFSQPVNNRKYSFLYE
jgi:hypothetical protein